MSEQKVEHPQPSDTARKLNQVICARLLGPFYGVYYPWRKTADLYVCIDTHPIHCCQCEEDIPVDKGLASWRAHIRLHARRKIVNPIIFAGRDNDGTAVAVQEVLQA